MHEDVEDTITDNLDQVGSRPSLGQPTPWLTVQEAADRAKCGIKLIYREVKAGRLQATRVSDRRTLRFLAEWIDAWLLDQRVIK